MLEATFQNTNSGWSNLQLGVLAPPKKTSVYHPWKRTLKPPIPSHVMNLKDVPFSSKKNKLQTSNLFTKFANKNLSENLKSLRVTQKRKWRFLLATKTLEKEWKSASEWWEKKSVFKNLCHQIAMIKTAGVQLNMWGVLGLYTVSWLIFMDCSKLL